jgi:putative transposase
VEENIEETLSFYRLPRQHHKHPKLTNMLERLMEEIKRPPLVVRIFPNGAACLRLIRAPAAEMHENWIEATRYLKMEPLAEQEKEALRRLGEAASTLSCSGLRPPQLSVHQREEHQIQRICRT